MPSASASGGLDYRVMHGGTSARSGRGVAHTTLGRSTPVITLGRVSGVLLSTSNYRIPTPWTWQGSTTAPCNPTSAPRHQQCTNSPACFACFFTPSCHAHTLPVIQHDLTTQAAHNGRFFSLPAHWKAVSCESWSKPAALTTPPRGARCAATQRPASRG